MDHIINTPNKIIKNFLTPEEAALLKYYTIFEHRNNATTFSNDFSQVKQGETAYYSNSITDAVLYSKLKKVNEETGVKCLPTYAYHRMYTYGGELEKHYDRPSCQISLTVNLGSDGTPWPIYVENIPYHLSPGDAVLYFGFDQLHWRDKFKGDWHSQLFLHYVDANGTFKMFNMDARDYYGVPHSQTQQQKLQNMQCPYLDNILANKNHKWYNYFAKRWKINGN